MKNKKIEGYWYHPIHSPEYLMPVKNALTQNEADEIYKLIKKKELTAQKIAYRGSALSRFDESVRVGSEEYETEEWAWPAGFAEHYVKLYRVKPSDEFLKYIGYYE